MDYRKHYDALIARARSRAPAGYVERHHVVPRCLGGGNEPTNIVVLTPEEHYVAHQLLVKLHRGDRRLVFAAWSMASGPGRSNKRYGWLKRRMSAAMTGTTHSEEARRKISEKARGRILSDEHVQRLRAINTGREVSAETRVKLAAIHRGKLKSDAHRAALSEARKRLHYTPELRAKLGANKGKPLNERQRTALLAATKGKPLSTEHKAKVSAAKRGKLQPVVSCPHCPTTGGESLMKRWHFDNCRSKP